MWRHEYCILVRNTNNTIMNHAYSLLWSYLPNISEYLRSFLFDKRHFTRWKDAYQTENYEACNYYFLLNLKPSFILGRGGHYHWKYAYFYFTRIFSNVCTPRPVIFVMRERFQMQIMRHRLPCENWFILQKVS